MLRWFETKEMLMLHSLVYVMEEFCVTLGVLHPLAKINFELYLIIINTFTKHDVCIV